MRLNRCRFNTVTTTHQAKFNKRERSQKRVKYVIMHRKVREGSIIILAWFIGPLSWNWIHLVCRNFFSNYQQIHGPRRRRCCGCLVLSDYWTFLASLLSGVVFLTFEPLKRTFLFLRWLQNLLGSSLSSSASSWSSSSSSSSSSSWSSSSSSSSSSPPSLPPVLRGERSPPLPPPPPPPSYSSSF